ncbi:MAG: FAD-dependent monooxygenase, partial [Acidobacteriota bacterium]|nr:FAD-dependent monooxygenase [Acidobacteriota bacterium]
MTLIKTQPTVLIVGAGPVGLSLALMLERWQVPYRIIDPSPEPAKESRALAIHARTLELFECLGIANEFTARGLPVDAVYLNNGPETLARISFEGLPSKYPYILSLPQHVTEEILNRHVPVERGIRLSGISQDGEWVTCEIVDSEGAVAREDFSYVVGCDGARSATRHLLGSSFEGGDYEESFVLADVKVEWDLPENEFHVFSGTQGLLAVFAFGNGRSRVIVSAKAGALPKEPTLEEVQALAEARGPGRNHLTDPAWITGFRIHHRMVKAFQQDRVFLAGDAAHIHSPAGGQGMNTGIQDA